MANVCSSAKLPDTEHDAASLRLGGYVPCSTQDWPGELAAVVFIAGCPWRCGYCQNTHLQGRQGDDALHWAELLPQLAARNRLLDGVVFTGGEPTIDSALPAALDDVRAIGLKTALHTAGCYPQRLARVLHKLDWVGLDIKALPQRYEAITGVPESGHRAWTSLGLIQASGVPYEVRVTAHPDWLPEADLDILLDQLAAANAPSIMLQAARLDGASGSKAHYRLSALSRWSRQIPGFGLRGF